MNENDKMNREEHALRTYEQVAQEVPGSALDDNILSMAKKQAVLNKKHKNSAWKRFPVWFSTAAIAAIGISLSLTLTENEVDELTEIRIAPLIESDRRPMIRQERRPAAEADNELREKRIIAEDKSFASEETIADPSSMEAPSLAAPAMKTAPMRAETRAARVEKRMSRSKSEATTPLVMSRDITATDLTRKPVQFTGKYSKLSLEYLRKKQPSIRFQVENRTAEKLDFQFTLHLFRDKKRLLTRSSVPLTLAPGQTDEAHMSIDLSLQEMESLTRIEVEFHEEKRL